MGGENTTIDKAIANLLYGFGLAIAVILSLAFLNNGYLKERINQLEERVTLQEKKINNIKLRTNEDVKNYVLDLPLDSNARDSIITNWELRFFEK